MTDGQGRGGQARAPSSRETARALSRTASRAACSLTSPLDGITTAMAPTASPYGVEDRRGERALAEDRLVLLGGEAAGADLVELLAQRAG